MSRRRLPWQFLVLEAAIIALAGIAAYLLLPRVAGHAAGLFLAGVATDRALIVVLRHARKPRRRKAPAWRIPARTTVRSTR